MNHDALNDSFPIPPDCSNWYPTQTDPRDGTVYRFFAHRVWLEMEVDTRLRAIECLVCFTINPEATEQFDMFIDNRKLVRESVSSDEFGRSRVRFALPAEAAITQHQWVRLELACGVTQRYSQLRMMSNDHRYFSLAVAQPIALF